MTKTQTQKEQEQKDSQESTETGLTVVEPVEVSDLFRRAINGQGKPRTLTMKRVLTRPLVSMSKRKQLACEVQSEIYLMDLPLTGRGGGMGSTRVFDAKELVATEHGFVNGDEVVVTCHEIMCSAIGKAGFASKATKTDAEGATVYIDVPGKPLKGALLAFISGDIADGKRYRSISVAELEG